MDLAPHVRIGRYRLLSMVGTGRSCQVWDSIDDNDGSHRALKILVGEYIGNREQTNLLKREFAVGRGLEHPQVIRVYDYQDFRGTVFLVMELFPAQNVKQFFCRQAWKESRIT